MSEFSNVASPKPKRGWALRLVRSESGETLVSTVMALPVLFLFLFGMMQLCTAYFTYEEISEMAREGARVGAVHGSTCMTSDGASCTDALTDIQNYTKGLAYPNIGGGTISVTASWPNPNSTSPADLPGNPVKVVVTYTFPYKIPFMTATPFTMTSVSQMTILM